jgi:hypothetical protein
MHRLTYNTWSDTHTNNTYSKCLTDHTHSHNASTDIDPNNFADNGSLNLA